MRIKADDYAKVQFRLSAKIYSGEIPATEDIDVIDFALKKQIPKRVVKSPLYGSDRCPICNDIVFRSKHYCGQCGQKLDWRIL